MGRSVAADRLEFSPFAVGVFVVPRLFRRIGIAATMVLVFMGERTISDVALAENFSVSVHRVRVREPVLPTNVERANSLAARLLALDEKARQAFDHEHPNVLPESRLWLPKSWPQCSTGAT